MHPSTPFFAASGSCVGRQVAYDPEDSPSSQSGTRCADPRLRWCTQEFHDLPQRIASGLSASLVLVMLGKPFIPGSLIVLDEL